MNKSSLTVLLLLLIILLGMVCTLYAPKQVISHGPAVRIVVKDLDTLYQIRLKYKTLHDTQILIKNKYDTLYITMLGDTTCYATQRLLAMHRQLDSCGK